MIHSKFYIDYSVSINFCLMDPTRMLLNNHHRIKIAQKCIQRLQKQKCIQNFIVTDHNQLRLLGDMLYITNIPNQNIHTIKRGLNNWTYKNLKSLCRDLDKLLQRFSDYLLSDDPQQQNIKKGRKIIEKFPKYFYQQFQTEFEIIMEESQESSKQKRIKRKKENKKRQKLSEQTICLADKLQIVQYLRQYDDNVEYLRYVGQKYGIGSENQDIYTLNLDFQNNLDAWRQLRSQIRHKKL